jgi:hypothetical protein
MTCILSCSKSPNSNSDYEGELYIKLLDAPTSYQKIEILIYRVLIHRNSISAGGVWYDVMKESTGRFDVLKLRNGVDMTLVASKVSIGKYDQIKIVFGMGRINVDGRDNDLLLDPSIQDGAVLNYQFEIIDGERFQLTFDLEVGVSVLNPAIGQYYWKPVFRIQQTDLCGYIVGSVLGPDSLATEATVQTYTGLDSVSTMNELSTGSFQLSALPEGTYSVTIVPTDSLLRDSTITDIQVVRRVKNNIGVIYLKYDQ